MNQLDPWIYSINTSQLIISAYLIHKRRLSNIESKKTNQTLDIGHSRILSIRKNNTEFKDNGNYFNRVCATN